MQATAQHSTERSTEHMHRTFTISLITAALSGVLWTAAEELQLT